MAILYRKPKYQYGGLTPTQDYTLDTGRNNNPVSSTSFVQTITSGDLDKTTKTNTVTPTTIQQPKMEYKKVGIKGAKDYIRIEDFRDKKSLSC